MELNVVEATISDLQHALSTGQVTSVDLVARYLIRVSRYDCRGPCLNSIPVLNPDVFEEARQADLQRRQGHSIDFLCGIPYTLKESMKYKGQVCSAGSPAFANLVAYEDSFVAEKLREAGAVCIGRTNTPPMMASGMHRGIHGRAESPYNLDYLTAAFSSGSSNGSGTSTAASFAAFGIGSETVSSGRSPASNNGLVAYTPSRTVISPRGVWPLYPTCDVIVPHTKNIDDMLSLLGTLTAQDSSTSEDFWQQQNHVTIPSVSLPQSYKDLKMDPGEVLRGKCIAAPKLYIGGRDSHPNAKQPFVSPEVVELWARAKADLTALGAIVVETDFPLVTNYEDDSLSGQTNNVVGFPQDWNSKERGELVAYLWDDFLKGNGDPNYPDLASVDGSMIFPRPEGYIPDKYIEHKNFMNYPRLVDIAGRRAGRSFWDIEGMAEALPALEAQRKRDLENWMDQNGYHFVAFPAVGDVGKADVDTNDESAKHALQNGVKYSNGNRALRHMGVPTISVPMGLMPTSRMPVNVTFAGKHGQDSDLLRYAYAYEQKSRRRIPPPLTPALVSDKIVLGEPEHSPFNEPWQDDFAFEVSSASRVLQQDRIHVQGTIDPEVKSLLIEAYVDGQQVDVSAIKVEGKRWSLSTSFVPFEPPKPLYGGVGTVVENVVVILLARVKQRAIAGKLVLINQKD